MSEQATVRSLLASAVQKALIFYAKEDQNDPFLALEDLMYVVYDAERLLERPTCWPLAEWHEDDGPVLWWRFPVNEPPYVGTPLDQGWPGYHTHWTRIEIPTSPAVNG